MSEAPNKPSEAFADLQAGVDFDDGLGDLDSPGIAKGKEKQTDLRSVDAEPRDTPAGDDDIQIVIDDGPAPNKQDQSSRRERTDPNDDDFSKKTRERIMRERRALHREREGRLAAEKRAADSDKELTELRAKFGDSEIQALTQQLKEARANADTEREAEIMAKISEAGAKRGQRKEAPESTIVDDGPPNEALKSWIDANPWWHSTDPQYAERRAKILRINAELYNNGEDEYSPDYYTEIDKRMADGGEVTRQPERQPAPRPQRGAAGGGEGGAARSNGGGNGRSVTITREDKEQMRRFKLDPANPAHLKQWAKQKRALA